MPKEGAALRVAECAELALVTRQRAVNKEVYNQGRGR